MRPPVTRGGVLTSPSQSVDPTARRCPSPAGEDEDRRAEQIGSQGEVDDFWSSTAERRIGGKLAEVLLSYTGESDDEYYGDLADQT